MAGDPRVAQRMIVEIAQIDVKPGLEAAFEAGVAAAVPLFRRAKGCYGVELKRSIEKQRRDRLFVTWETVEKVSRKHGASFDYASLRSG
jgi:heme-degrading monooxygenase HmoA